ncbi:uncharacterized protein LOC128548819 [Mercenaria mercenaria]|uniref:uncharacterized protein LOC128548819 n=1 Tax=Mercenaria mercenaria TaxID=6596 RepID=UPI00234F90D5|nr:uncharacterized protein LOC128548819 [Mercenaria mercenaria]
MERLQMQGNKIHNWTILLTVNNGFYDFFLNWRWHFKQLNIYLPISVIAEDDIVFGRLTSLKDSSMEVQRSERVSINETVAYNSPLYRSMVSERPTYILKYLKKGTDIIYSDMDTVWLQNPLPYLEGDYDIWSQMDGKTVFCTGFLAIKSNNNTKKFVQKWEDSFREKPTLNQPIFNKLVKNSTINIKALDRERFPSGIQYFEKFSKEERSGVVVVHNNWIVGHNNKIKRFQDMKLWAN